MNLWKSKKYLKTRDAFSPRSGLRLRFDHGVDPEVRRACKEFAKWLRKQYTFPVRIPIYFKAAEYIRAMDGSLVSATFFEPYEKSMEPYIRISTGDYCSSVLSCGTDNALAGILHSMAHELTHYFQWINSIQLTEIGAERQAANYANRILLEYAQTRLHP